MGLGKVRLWRLQTCEVSELTELCAGNLLMLRMETRLPQLLWSAAAGERVIGSWFWSKRASLARSIGCVVALDRRLASKFVGEIRVADCALLSEWAVHF